MDGRVAVSPSTVGFVFACRDTPSCAACTTTDMTARVLEAFRDAFLPLRFHNNIIIVDRNQTQRVQYSTVGQQSRSVVPDTLLAAFAQAARADAVRTLFKNAYNMLDLTLHYCLPRLANTYLPYFIHGQKCFVFCRRRIHSSDARPTLRISGSWIVRAEAAWCRYLPVPVQIAACALVSL